MYLAIQEYSEGGDYSYGSNIAGYNPEAGKSNDFAGYWFGIFYVLFYLSDTFTNVPYEALGPEMHSDTEVRYTCNALPLVHCALFLVSQGSANLFLSLCTSFRRLLPPISVTFHHLIYLRFVQERAKLFFTQKLVNMTGMIFAAISPALIALFWRERFYVEYPVDCSYIFHSDSNETHILHGTKVDQLLYVDDHSSGLVINKTAEFCESGEGKFCFEVCYTSLSLSAATGW